MFPARAGMSPMETLPQKSAMGVPRASGDEPTIRSAIRTLESCSPRERG